MQQHVVRCQPGLARDKDAGRRFAINYLGFRR
jgi:hypothetical protein